MVAAGKVHGLNCVGPTYVLIVDPGQSHCRGLVLAGALVAVELIDDYRQLHLGDLDV